MAWLYNQSPQVKAPEVTDPSPAQLLPRDKTTQVTQVLCPWGRQAEGPSSDSAPSPLPPAKQQGLHRQEGQAQLCVSALFSPRTPLLPHKLWSCPAFEDPYTQPPLQSPCSSHTSPSTKSPQALCPVLPGAHRFLRGTVLVILKLPNKDMGEGGLHDHF